MPYTSTLESPLPGQIDPVARNLLDQFKDYPSFSQMDIPTARQVVAKLAADCAGTPASIAQQLEHSITVHGKPLEVQAYVAHGADKSLAPVLYLHGGGFITGSPAVYDAVLRNLAASLQRVVIAPTYSLSPECRFPGALDEVEATYAWLRAGKGHDYQAADQGVVIAGDSAGGNLTAALSLRLARRGEKPLGQVLLYPATNFADLETPSIQRFGEGHFITRGDLAYFMTQYLPEGVKVSAPEVSPQQEVSSKLPETLVITAEFDPLHSDGQTYARKLVAEGVPVRYHCMHGQIHAFHLLPGLFPAAQEVNQIIQQFVEHLGSQRKNECFAA